jgi:hypothetical protein
MTGSGRMPYDEWPTYCHDHKLYPVTGRHGEIAEFLAGTAEFETKPGSETGVTVVKGAVGAGFEVTVPRGTG